MARSKISSKILVVFSYLLAIIILIVALIILGASSLIGISWIFPIFGLVFGMLIFWLVNKNPRASEILPLLGTILPPLKELLELENKKNKFFPRLRTIEHFINFYGLNSRFEARTSDHYYTFSDAFRTNTIKKIPHDTDGEFEILEFCANAVEEKLTPPPIFKNVLLALCLSEGEKDAKIIYGKIKKNEAEINDLAEILEKSQHLPHQALIPYTKDDIVFVLKGLDVFSLQKVKEEFDGVQIVWEIAFAYQEFLTENEVTSQKHIITIRDILQTDGSSAFSSLVLSELDTKDKRILTSLICIGEKFLPKTNITKSLNNIALAMFFNEKFPSYDILIKTTCKLAAPRSSAVKMAFAYIELREMSRKENKFVSVKEVLTQWKAINKKKKEDVPKGYERDIEVIKNNLAKGIWMTRLHPVASESFDMAGKDFGRQSKRMEIVAQNRPDAINALRRVFNTLSISTIERFLEARTIVAYLLTFNAQEGHLANLVDSLVKRKPDKYLLLQYIKQCRIGIVPRDMSFQDFCAEFEKDLIREYQAQGNGQIKEFEMIVHRFGLAGNERYDFDNFNETEQKKKAGPNIRLLLGDNLNIAGLVEAAGWEFGTGAAGIEKLISLMLEERISRLVEKQIGGLTPSETEYLDTNHENWKSRLSDEFGYNRQFVPFAKSLVQLTDSQDRKHFLAELINNGPDVPRSLKNSNRCQLIASLYFDTIADIASIE